jgi:hypothetical protein
LCLIGVLYMDMELDSTSYPANKYWVIIILIYLISHAILLKLYT